MMSCLDFKPGTFAPQPWVSQMRIGYRITVIPSMGIFYSIVSTILVSCPLVQAQTVLDSVRVCQYPCSVEGMMQKLAEFSELYSQPTSVRPRVIWLSRCKLPMPQLVLKVTFLHFYISPNTPENWPGLQLIVHVY